MDLTMIHSIIAVWLFVFGSFLFVRLDLFIGNVWEPGVPRVHDNDRWLLYDAI